MRFHQPQERALSLGEEIANSVTHGLGLVASLVALPVLVAAAVARASVWNVVGAGVFGVTAVVLYLTSTVYHALPQNRVKQVFQMLDHSAIYLLIAGTYTPFTLGVLRGGWGWTLFGLVWGMAVIGVVFKVMGGLRYPRLSTLMYVAMGWLVVIAIRPLFGCVAWAGIVWIFAGGVFYTGGVVFFVWERLRYSHMVWHLCVLAGTTCHFFAVLWYSA